MSIVNHERRVVDRRAIEQRDSRLEFETQIPDLSSRFINLRPDEVDREIEDALRRVCEPLGIDLAVLWQWLVAVPDVVAPTHVYFSQVGLRPKEPMRQEQYPWSRQQMLAGCTVIVSRLDDLPPEAAVDQQTCRLYGIKSVLCLPLSIGDEPPIGALGFNALREERDWPDSLVKKLQLIAQIFTNALARKRHEQSLKESETRLAVGAELAGLGFYDVDFSEGAVYAEGRFLDICGVPPEREIGLGKLEFWMEQLHPDDREHVLDMRRKLHDGTLEELSIEYRFLHPVKGERWIEHVGRVTRRDAGGRTLRSHGVLRDVTANKRTEHEMRDLSRRLIRAHEDERALLARELHDDVTQRLAVLAIEVGRAELAAPDAAQAATMQTVREGLTLLSEDIHTMAYQLHPSILRELGLAEALRAECERRTRQGQLELSLDLDSLPFVVGNDAALCLFRVAQEALNNVARHAAARTASVTLRPIDSGLLLAVRDDGVGFDPAHRAERIHLGLVSMRERVRLVDGTLDIESAPGMGTTVVAWVPVQSVAQ